MHHCSLCDYSSPSAWNVKRHMKTHETNDTVVEEINTCCQYCLKDFSNKYNRKRHEISCKHKVIENQEISPEVALDFTNGCAVSPKVALLHQKLRPPSPKVALDDESDYDENGSFPCPFCYKKFTSKWNLQKHENNGKCSFTTHPFMCHKCKKVCSSKYAKSRHVKKCDGTGNEEALISLDENVLPNNQGTQLPSSNSAPSQITQQNVQNGNIINNNNYIIVNNNNNIHVNALGTEDLTDILNPDYLGERVYEINGKGIYQMIKDVHFNETKPENHNIRIHSRKRKQLKVCQDDGWHIQHNNDILTMLIAKYKRIIQLYLCDPVSKERMKHETDFMQIQQNLLKFNEMNNPKFYFECAHKVLALIEDLEINYSNRNRNDILQLS